MLTKLVKLDPENGWRFSAIDPIALKRNAIALKEYVEENILPDADEYEIASQVRPLYEAALNDIGKFPIKFEDLPLKQLSREGLLSRDFYNVWANFCVTATGSRLEKTEEVIIDGDRYSYMEFEEPGDWPNVVNQRREERRQKLAKEFD